MKVRKWRKYRSENEIIKIMLARHRKFRREIPELH